MSSEKPKRLRGRRSYVLTGKSKGGTIYLRVDQDLHRQLASRCKSLNVTLNRYAEEVLRASLEDESCQRN